MKVFKEMAFVDPESTENPPPMFAQPEYIKWSIMKPAIPDFLTLAKRQVLLAEEFKH